MMDSQGKSLLVALVAGCCCVACQQTPPPGGSVGVRNYSDAVVHIGQVDPAYQAYFRDQNAANYSLSDQRKAYIAAAQTARTPVRESDYRPSVSRSSSGRYARSSGNRARVVRKGSASSKRRVAARKKTTRRR